MKAWIKEYWYWIVGGIVVTAVVVFMRDSDRAVMLAQFFKRKRVEDDVAKIKESLSAQNAEIAVNDDQLTDLAIQMKEQKVQVQNASDKEIGDFYTEFFKQR
jgi:shikimate 5-dehydrogenase